MGFIKVLGDIHTNSHKFKEWENRENDNEARRKALQERHPLSEKELKEKQRLANTIIDTISVMDQHSEDVAEDVETITQPITGFSMFAGFIAAGIPGFKFIMEKEHELRKITDKIVDKLTGNEFNTIQNENKQSWLSKYAILSTNKKHTEKIKIPDQLKSKVNNLRNEIAKANKTFTKYPILVASGILAAGITSFLTAVLVTTKMQVGSSRVARFQAREQLNDPKNFIVYTDEQIAQAKENLKNKPEEKKSFWSWGKKDDEKTGIKDSFKNIKNLIKDNKRYNKWKAQNANRDMRIMRDLTPEELDEAKRDKEIIQRLTKKINNKAEEYSQNMETAAGTIIGSSLIGGPIIGGSISWIMNKLGVGEKAAARLIKSLTNEETQNLYQRLISLKPDSDEYKSLQKEFHKSIRKAIYGEKLEFEFPKFQRYKKMGQKWLAKHAATASGRNRLLAYSAGVISTVVGMIIALKLQKQASRAGRYIAKEEFKNNPQEFVAYTDEEMQEVQDIKAKKEPIGRRIKNYLMFVPTAIKQHREYMAYKKGTYKEEKALREELVKLEVTPEQLREGKNLQRKLFNTFEKIDDKSQEYSENMEAAADIATQFSQMAGIGAIFAPIIALGAGIASGKISPAKLGISITEFLSRFSFIAKSKFFKNYLSEVTSNIEKRIQNQYYYQFELNGLNGFPKNVLQQLKNIKPEKAQYINNFLKNESLPLIQLLQKFAIGSSKELLKLLNDVNAKDIKVITDKILNLQEKEAVKILKELTAMPIEKMAKTEELRKILNTKGKMNLSDKELNSLTTLFKQLNTVIDTIDTNISKHKETLNPLAIKNKNKENILDAILNNNIKIKDYIEAILKNENIRLDSYSSSTRLTKTPISKENLQKYENFFNICIKDKKHLQKGVKALEKIVANIPVEELNAAVAKLIKLAMENPEKFALILNEPSQLKSVLITKSLKKALFAAEITWGVFVTGIIFTVQSYFAKLQKEAGRLGVMKAMEELQDDRIYADETPKAAPKQTTGNQPSTAYSNLPENIQKLLKK